MSFLPSCLLSTDTPHPRPSTHARIAQIPLFVPSVALLTQWHLTYTAVNERTWPTVLGSPAASSPLPRHPHAPPGTPTSDPNDETTAASVKEWLGLADFYQWPHITTFDSWEHLFAQLTSVDLGNVSRSMRTYNVEEGARIKGGWERVLNKVAMGKRARLAASGRGLRGGHGNASVVGDGGEEAAMPPRARVNRALRRGYGVEMVRGCHGQVASTAGRGRVPTRVTQA